ncbi:PE domain-containing protein [Nocardia cyriacigeorgica]|uniref:PE domain-containing protein n=1 Tax=Nocardia cyriacigeorgica TaxID=135487 RepID=A0A6P1D6E5_9NOCA|nr:PE domain-containing protein [Nocardia cyriacigeorgica]NEW40666.1 PE domain-containing protein [Nocardia cyriacigeorgica]NEW45139.1 PE domain-containing protein [Nocardia cyriacigeorgica]NEW51106.1 PE domain-containing protein [Nocardia cyriacigeorgica]NEW54311.1 PE domain-containing protein [Nocardia cyriacigeorgica]
MTLPLNVSSEHLLSTSAGMGFDQAAFEAALVHAAPGTQAMPAALDVVVSGPAAAVLNAAGMDFLGIIGDGAFKRRNGGEVLKPVAVEYTANDIASGGRVSSLSPAFL